MKRIAVYLVIITLMLPACFSRKAWGQGDVHLYPHGQVLISVIENEQTHAIAKEVLREAYKRLGYETIFAELPARRALIWANEGRTDGDVARIEGTGEMFPNLVRVPIAVTQFKGVAFTITVKANIIGWQDLKPYRVGIVRGIRYSAIGTEGMQPLPANDMTHLFDLLASGRVEIAVAVEEAGLIEISRHFHGKGIHVIGEPLHVASLYHFVNKKRADLAPALTAVLEEMTKTGEVEAIHRRVFFELMAQ